MVALGIQSLHATEVGVFHQRPASPAAVQIGHRLRSEGCGGLGAAIEEAGAFQHRALQIGSTQMAAGKVGAAQIAAGQIAAAQIGAIEVDAA